MGFVLAGGRSSRMGRDKALLLFRGKPLVESVAGTVQRAAGAVILVGDPKLYKPLGYPVIPDLHPGEGPLGGILTALTHSSAQWNLILACDMPGVTAEFLGDLLERAEHSTARVLLPTGPSGRPEPLCAVYHIDSRPALERAFAAGTRKIAAALETVPVTRVEVLDAAMFHNVNTPDDWERYAGK